MTKKTFAISLLIIAMIILSSMMPLHGSPTEVKEEQEKRQQQHLAYATPTITPTPPSSFSFLPSTNYFNFAVAGDWGCNS